MPRVPKREPIPQSELVRGVEYISVLRGFSPQGKKPKRFIGITKEGFTEFNAGEGLTSSSNPAAYNYYAVDNGLVTLLAISPHIGNVAVPVDAENAISYEPFNNGDEIVIITQGGHSYYYHIGPLNQYYITTKDIDVRNPQTNLVIGNKNTGKLVAGVKVQRAKVQQPDGPMGGRIYRRKTKRARKLRRKTRRSH